MTIKMDTGIIILIMDFIMRESLARRAANSAGIEQAIHCLFLFKEAGENRKTGGDMDYEARP